MALNQPAELPRSRSPVTAPGPARRAFVRTLASSTVARFLGIGVLSTCAYALLFVLLAGPLGSVGASAVALIITAVANTAANRRLTFGVRGRAGLVRQQLGGLVVFAVALALTTGALAVLHSFDAHPSRPLETSALVLANLCATVTRYVALSSWVFNARERSSAPGPPTLGSSS
jgi:putative flippase GtrA